MTPTTPPAPPVPPSWVIALVSDLREEMTGQHSRLRTDMSEGFDKIADRIDRKFDEFAREQAGLRSRLDRIEAKQEAERGVVVMVTTAISLLIGALGLWLGWNHK